MNKKRKNVFYIYGRKYASLSYSTSDHFPTTNRMHFSQRFTKPISQYCNNNRQYHSRQ